MADRTPITMSIMYCVLTVLLAVSTHAVKIPCADSLEVKGKSVACHPCNLAIDKAEVHARSITRQRSGTCIVDITLKEGARLRPVRLVLISPEPLKWHIKRASLVYVDKIVTVSPAGINTPVNIAQEFSNKNVKHVYAANLYNLKDPLLPGEVERLVQEELGTLTSYAANYSHAASFKIVLGVCDPVSPIANVPKLSDEQEGCLYDSKCLLEMWFDDDKSWTDCDGKKYITKYKDLFVGIVLCQPNRFKLLLSNVLRGRYLNIGDRNPVTYSYGADHCELLGMSESLSKTSNETKCPGAIGFYRSWEGTPFLYGKICGHAHTPLYTGMFSPRWYECSNMHIPGTFRVVSGPPQFRKLGEDERDPGETKSGPPLLTVVHILAITIPVGIIVIVSVIVIVLCHRRHQRGLNHRIMYKARPPAELPTERVYDQVYDNPRGLYWGAPEYSPPPPPSTPPETPPAMHSVSEGLMLVVKDLLPARLDDKPKQTDNAVDEEGYAILYTRSPSVDQLAIGSRLSECSDSGLTPST